MIHAVYYKKYHRVTVKGHAHSAEKGRDLVCAAAYKGHCAEENDHSG